MYTAVARLIHVVASPDQEIILSAPDRLKSARRDSEAFLQIGHCGRCALP